MLKSQEFQGFIRLDLKDRKILYQLDRNARQSASEIGKKVGLSKQVVLYRINQLVNTGVIKQLYAVYDTSKLGFTTYKIFLRLQNIDLKKQNEIIEYIKNHKRVQYFMTCDGMFDLIFNVLAKNALELYDIIKELEIKFGEYIAEKELIAMILSSFFFKDYLIRKSFKELRKPIYFGSKPEIVRIDDIDKKILHCLAIDARISVMSISNKIKISPDTISLRIKKLEKAQIIQNYVLLPNSSLLNQTSYKVLFSLRNLNENREESFFNFCKTQPNIWFHSKSLGRWDVEINLDVDNANQFREIMIEIKSNFSDIIKDYITLQISNTIKVNFYPID